MTKLRWTAGPPSTAHQFDIYRHGYGWTVLNAALTADDEYADARMQAGLDWWAEHHTSTPYQIHRILVAIDDTTWASRDEIAQRLNITPADLELTTPTADALDAATRHGLIIWPNPARTGRAAGLPRGWPAPAALTPTLEIDQHLRRLNGDGPPDGVGQAARVGAVRPPPKRRRRPDRALPRTTTASHRPGRRRQLVGQSHRLRDQVRAAEPDDRAGLVEQVTRWRREAAELNLD